MSSLTLLIVEDNASVRRMLRRALANLSADIYECADGADALQTYTERQPDVVLMDVRMPIMDGLTAARQILSDYPLARVVMVTDYDDEEIRNAAQEAGACAYALKQDLGNLEYLITQAVTPSSRTEKSI